MKQQLKKHHGPFVWKSVQLIYKNRMFSKKVKEGESIALNSIINSIKSHITGEDTSIKPYGSDKKQKIDNAFHRNYEIEYKGKYVKATALNTDFDQKFPFRVFDSKLNRVSFLDRVDPQRQKANELSDHLLNNKSKNSFFDFFLQKQGKISLQRGESFPNASEIAKKIQEFSNFEENQGMSAFTTLMMFLADYKYRAILDQKFEIKRDETIYPSISWSQNLSHTEKRFIFGKHLTIPLEGASFALASILVLKAILNKDDLRYVGIDNAKKVQSLNSNLENTLAELNHHLQETDNLKIKVNCSKSQFGPEVIEQLKTIRANILENQDQLHKDWLKKLEINSNEDPVVANIKKSKLYCLEVNLTQKVLTLLIRYDSQTKFRLSFSSKLEKAVFDFFNEIRQISKINKMSLNKHQIGIIYFSGYAIILYYERPAHNYLESSFHHLECSKVFNLNVKDSKFEIPEDAADFLKTVHTYAFSLNREIETIKNIHTFTTLNKKI